jgi:hypothetical protein
MQKMGTMTGSEYEWHAARGERISYGITAHAPQVHIERGSVESVHINDPAAAVLVRGDTWRLAASIATRAPTITLLKMAGGPTAL